MKTDTLEGKAISYLHRLCLDISSRRTGSPGNREATDFFARQMASCGFAVEIQDFDCLDWIEAGAVLSSSGNLFAISPSPFSPDCQALAPLRVASTREELEAVNVTGEILLMHGEIAREPLMPKNFPFYNPEEHRQIISLLEAKKPLAILTASPRNPQMAGASYPYPMIEDGDFEIPSAFMTDGEGEKLSRLAGQQVGIEIRARRIPATGCNVIARKGKSQERRVVFCAHIDAKEGTPGALDNAAGITTLLLLADLLEGYQGSFGIDIAAINGEDYYSNPGEQLYLSGNEGRFGDILLAVNLDGVGYIQGKTAYSMYECPPELERAIKSEFSACPALVEGERWYQGDHSLFIMNGCPALAITSERVSELMASYIHTSQDLPELVDPARLVELAGALFSLLGKLDLAYS